MSQSRLPAEHQLAPTEPEVSAVRPISADGSRERIHAAARGLISRYGFDGVSLQKLADEVGLHKSTLFHHYKNKQQIAEEVLGETVAAIVVAMQPLEEPPTSLDQLLELSDLLVDHFSDQPDAARLLLAAMVAPEDSAVHDAGAGAGSVERFYVLLFGWLRRARELGVIRRVSIRQTVFCLMGLILVYPAVAEVEQAVTGPEPFSDSSRRMRKQMLRDALSGMLRP